MYEQRVPDSEVIECVWQARATRDERYLVPAVEFWDLWFARDPDGTERAGIAGPTLGHRSIRSAIGEHSWGVQLKAHVVLPGMSKQLLLGGEQDLDVQSGLLTIAGHALPFPEFADLEDFVATLRARDVLRSDDVVREMLTGTGGAGYSERQRQRLVRATTGLTRKQIEQLARAREAYALLLQGIAPRACAAACGFADQAHLTRSLKAFHGQTPARVLAG